MNDNPNSHDFDWVTARLQCSIPNEFERLRLLVKEHLRVRNLSLCPKRYPSNSNSTTRRTKIPFP